MQIRWYNANSVADSQKKQVEEKLHDLAEQGRRDLEGARIAGHPSGHHRKGGQEVRITCGSRGREIVAVRTADDIGHALHDAMEAVEVQVRRMRDRERQRGGAV